MPAFVFPSGYIGSPTATFIGTSADESNLTTYTFSSQSIGELGPNRMIAVPVYGFSTTSGRTISSATIGGITAVVTQVTDTASGNSAVSAIVSAMVPTGTTADIVVTFSAGMLRCAVGVFRVINVLSPTPTSSDTDTNTLSPSTTVTAGRGSVTVATIGVSDNTGNPGTITHSGVTQDFQIDVGSLFNQFAGGQDEETGSTISGTIANDDDLGSAMVAAVFR